MASRGRHPSISSRASSPDTYPERYDPFEPQQHAGVEMSNMSQRSLDYRRSPSPAQGNRSQSSYFATLRGVGANSQYAPLEDPWGGPSSSRQRVSTAASIHSIGGLSHHKTMDADAQALVDRRAGEIAKWHIYWKTPALITALFIAGVAGALGHHFFYVHLDGRPADDQLGMIRYGTAMAFFVKSTLVGVVVMCYRQRIWRTFRMKAMTLHGIDGLFSATENPAQFFYNFEMIRNGKLATFMAACSWLIPIASVLSPASLTTDLRTFVELTTCDSVATLNFTRESYYNFRNEDVYRGSSLAFYNTTDRDAEDEGWFDYFDEPSKHARRLAVTSAYLKKPATGVNASLNSCGEGWNCTYSLTFQGPGYKCEEADNGAPFNLSILAPEGENLYKAVVDEGDYWYPQTDSGDGGEPKEGPPYPDWLGAFQAEPILWLGHSINTYEPLPDSSPHKEKWKFVHEPKIFKCVAHHTNYTFQLGYNDTIQTARRTAREFLHPLVETSLEKDKDNNDTLVGRPKSKWVRPGDDPKLYKLTAAYHSMGSLLRMFLRGEIRYTGLYVTNSDISETILTESRTSYPINNLMEGVQDMFEDMLITLLSEEHLVIAETQDVPCEKSRTMNVYVYHRQGLWIGYAIAVVISFGTMIIGSWSMWQNGVASDTQFSRIMATTRNPTIDRLSVGACLGSSPFPRELRETKLRFGVLLEEAPMEGPLGTVEHCAFGAAGETKEIVKGGVYAGLRKYRRDGEEEGGSAEEKQSLLSENKMI